MLFAVAAAFALWVLSTTYADAPFLVWAGLAVLPFASGVAWTFSGVVRRRSQASREAGSQTTSGVEEGVSGVAAVQSLGGSERGLERLAPREHRAL